MTTLQRAGVRLDAASIGRPAITQSSAGIGEFSEKIEERLRDLDRSSLTLPGPPIRLGPAAGRRRTVTTVPVQVRSIGEQLYDALAAFKTTTAAIAMHIDRDRRSRLFQQLDNLLALEDWQEEDRPPTADSFSTFLRLLTSLKPARRPGLGATTDGHLIAAWTKGSDRLTIECLPKDYVRWHLSAMIAGEKENAAALTPLTRLGEVLAPYHPERWFAADAAYQHSG